MRIPARIIGTGLASLILGVSTASSQEAGSVIVKGVVRGFRQQAPIAGATVVVELVGLVSENFGTPIGFLRTGERKILSTDSQGRYTTALRLPVWIPAGQLFIKVTVDKMQGPPFYTEGFTQAAVPRTVPSGSRRTVKADMILFDYPTLHYGAFVKGAVRDRESGERLPGVTVGFRTAHRADGSRTDTDGEYSFVIQLRNPTETAELRFWPRADGHPNLQISNGVSYADPAPQQIALQSGRTYVVHKALARADAQTAVVGRVTDRAGRPIPGALVRLRLVLAGVVHGAPHLSNSGAVTDTFGRYALPVLDMSSAYLYGQAQVSQAVVETNGTFMEFSSPSAPYENQRVNVADQLVGPDGRVRRGEVIELNLSLHPVTR